MTEPNRNAERRAQKRLDALLAQPGALDRLDRVFARIDTDPDFAAKVGPLVVRTFRRIDRLSAIRADAGRTGGIAAGRSMTAEERITRAHKGGVAAFYRGGNASTYARYLVDRREKKRRRSRLNLLK